MDRRVSYSALPPKEATTATAIVRQLSRPPYFRRWVAVPVGGSRSEMREKLRRLGRDEELLIDTRILGAHSILVRVGGARQSSAGRGAPDR